MVFFFFLHKVKFAIFSARTGGNEIEEKNVHKKENQEFGCLLKAKDPDEKCVPKENRKMWVTFLGRICSP